MPIVPQLNEKMINTSFLQSPKIRLGFILILALFIRLEGITSRPIWYDEAFSILLAEQGPAAIISGTLAPDADSSAAEEHPPAYYFMLWGWMKIFGSSLVAARMLSIIASLGSIFLVYKITEHLFDSNTALTSGLICAILPFQIHYGQEIRMYVLMTFWLCLATYAFLKRQWILFGIAAALAQYTHNLSAFYLIPLALTPLFQRDWKTLRALTLAGLGALILYTPWLMHLPAQMAKVGTNFWIEKPGIEKIFNLMLVYLPNLPLPNAMLLPGLLFAALTIILAVFQTYRAKTAEGYWLAWLSFAMPAMLWLVSQAIPIYVERALLPAQALFCIWLAWALTKTKLPRPIQIFTFAMVFISAGMGIYQHITYAGFPYIRAKAITENIQSELRPGDIIIHSNKLSYLPSFYFDRALPQTYIADLHGSGTDTLSSATRKIMGLNVQENIESAAANAGRVWFIIYEQSINESKSQGLETHPHLAYLNQRFTLESVITWDGIQVFIYSRKTP
jgi:4-amino-4-deoxy-L-arabinose transferase-like glycosyltransferase